MNFYFGSIIWISFLCLRSFLRFRMLSALCCCFSFFAFSQVSSRLAHCSLRFCFNFCCFLIVFSNRVESSWTRIPLEVNSAFFQASFSLPRFVGHLVIEKFPLVSISTFVKCEQGIVRSFLKFFVTCRSIQQHYQ